METDLSPEKPRRRVFAIYLSLWAKGRLISANPLISKVKGDNKGTREDTRMMRILWAFHLDF
jgi:hypothetical protein